MFCGLLFNRFRSKSGPCLFCDVSDGPGFKVVSEDSKYIMFLDIAPAAAWHYLVVPREHVESVHDLDKSHAEMVREMLEFGDRFFDSEQIARENRRYGFHIPPFTSVDHLHLHCLGLPLNGLKSRLKFRPSGHRHRKGWGWFIDAEQTIRLLQSGGRVRISPC